MARIVKSRSRGTWRPNDIYIKARELSTVCLAIYLGNDLSNLSVLGKPSETAKRAFQLLTHRDTNIVTQGVLTQIDILALDTAKARDAATRPRRRSSAVASRSRRAGPIYVCERLVVVRPKGPFSRPLWAMEESVLKCHRTRANRLSNRLVFIRERRVSTLSQFESDRGTPRARRASRRVELRACKLSRLNSSLQFKFLSQGD